MVSRTPPQPSLKKRITLVTLGIFLAGIWALSFFASTMLRADMARLLSEQQRSTVSIIAAQINDQLDARRSALGTVAGLSTQAMFDDPVAMQEFVQSLLIFHSLFNERIVALDPDGNVIADLPLATGLSGFSPPEVAAVVDSLKEGELSIALMPGSNSTPPAFAIVMPIRNAQGGAEL